MRDQFIILDGHGLIYRAIFRPGPPLTSPSGEPTRGTYTFCATLFSLVQHLKPAYLAMATDAPRKSTFRRKLFPGYKAKRANGDDGPPKEVVVQLARCNQIAKLLGIPLIGAPEFEADDVIATLVDICAGDEVECVVASRDKDFHQLVGRNCRAYDPADREWIDAKHVQARWGVPPNKVVEVMNLQGDPTDCIPGIKGIGPKKALKLILEHGTAREAAHHCGFDKDELALQRKLVELRRDVPLIVSPEDLAFNGFNMKNVRPLFQELGFRSFL